MWYPNPWRLSAYKSVDSLLGGLLLLSGSSRWADILGTRKRCLLLELAAYGKEKIQSLYGSWEKRGFVKAAFYR